MVVVEVEVGGMALEGEGVVEVVAAAEIMVVGVVLVAVAETMVVGVALDEGVDLGGEGAAEDLGSAAAGGDLGGVMAAEVVEASAKRDPSTMEEIAFLARPSSTVVGTVGGGGGGAGEGGRTPTASRSRMEASVWTTSRGRARRTTPAN